MRGCPPCSPPNFDFGKCMLRRILGPVVSAHCPPRQKVRGALTQTQALLEFFESPVANEVCAAKVSEDQTGIGSPYWFAKLGTRCYQNKGEHAFAGHVIGAGFLVVKALDRPILPPHSHRQGQARLRWHPRCGCFFFFLRTKSSVSKSPLASEFHRLPCSGSCCPARSFSRSLSFLLPVSLLAPCA